MGRIIMPEYNLNNPSVREEEQIIQDRIDEKYAMIEAENFNIFWLPLICMRN